MKLIVATALMCGLGLSAWAQSPSPTASPTAKGESKREEASRQQGARTAQARGFVDLSALKGKTVMNSQGEKLGSLERVLIDPQSGRIRYGILEVDRAWNWNDPKVAVPWQAFDIQRQSLDDARITLEATKDKLMNAPKFKEGEVDQLYSRQGSRPIYSYWAIIWIEDVEPVGEGPQSDESDQGGRERSGSGMSRPGSSPGASPGYR